MCLGVGGGGVREAHKTIPPPSLPPSLPLPCISECVDRVLHSFGEFSISGFRDHKIYMQPEFHPSRNTGVVLVKGKGP